MSISNLSPESLCSSTEVDDRARDGASSQPNFLVSAVDILDAPAVPNFAALPDAHADLTPTVESNANAEIAAGADPLDLSERTRPDERAERLALAIFRFFEHRSEIDLRFLFAASAPRPKRMTSDDAAKTIACAALQAATDRLGHEPSRREYDRLRAESSDSELAVSSSWIRKVYGSWNSAVADLGVPQADVLARRLLSNGRAFSDAEKQAALKRFAAAVPPGRRTRHAYSRWARAYMQTPGAHEVPLTPDPFTRDGGGWAEALLRAGLANEAEIRTVAPAVGKPYHTRYDDQAILEALHQAAADLSMQAPNYLDYTRWRQGLLPDARQRIPNVTTIYKRFGGWGRALHAGGMIDAQALRLYRKPTRMSEEEQLSFVAAAMRDRGPQLTLVGYRDWRWTVLAHPDWPGERVPSVEGMLDRWGRDFQAIKARARRLKPHSLVTPHLHQHDRRAYYRPSRARQEAS